MFGELDGERAGGGGFAHPSFTADEDPLKRRLIDDILEARVEMFRHYATGNGQGAGTPWFRWGFRENEIHNVCVTR